MTQIVCHDCHKVMRKGSLVADYKNGFFKCKKCHQKNPVLRNFQETEVYSRVVGYIRPVKQWNKGKREEFDDRKEFKIKGFANHK